MQCSPRCQPASKLLGGEASFPTSAKSEGISLTLHEVLRLGGLTGLTGFLDILR